MPHRRSARQQESDDRTARHRAGRRRDLDLHGSLATSADPPSSRYRTGTSAIGLRFPLSRLPGRVARRDLRWSHLRVRPSRVKPRASVARQTDKSRRRQARRDPMVDHRRSRIPRLDARHLPITVRALRPDRSTGKRHAGAQKKQSSPAPQSQAKDEAVKPVAAAIRGTSSTTQPTSKCNTIQGADIRQHTAATSRSGERRPIHGRYPDHRAIGAYSFVASSPDAMKRVVPGGAARSITPSCT